MDWIDTLLIPAVKAAIVFVMMILSVPVQVILERKIIGRIQQRPGPNRVGFWALIADHPFKHDGEPITRLKKSIFRNGELQPIIDAIKLFLKEDFIPPRAERAVFILAPAITLLPALVAISIVPFGPDFTLTLGGEARTVSLGLSDLSIGILFYLAVTSVGVYGIVLAGWSSNSKYALLGAVRSAAQLISYELALGLSLIGVLLIAGTFNMMELVESQSEGVWAWHIFRQPLGFLLFLVAGFGETNRLPFDLPEGESELGAGFHTEYSSIKFAIFFMAEYMNIFTFSAVMTTMFLGGYHGLIAIEGLPAWLAVLSGLFWFFLKVFMLFFFFVLVRGTLPRLRYDQLMNLGWKVMFPLALANVMATAGIIAFSSGDELREGIGLFIAGCMLIFIADRAATIMKRRILSHAA